MSSQTDLRRILDEFDARAGTKLVLMTLVLFENEDNQCAISLTDLTRYVGVSKPTVISHLRQLRERGFITQVWDGGASVTRYQTHLPWRR